MNAPYGGQSAIIQPRRIFSQGPNLILLDCRPLDDYEFCHIAGAVHADTESDLSAASTPGHHPRNGGRHPLPTIANWQARLRSWGVQNDSRVLVYDDAHGAEGAARAWWMLTASGINAAVLDGGWGGAVKARVPIDEEIPQPTKSDFTFDHWLLPTVDIESVDKLRQDPEWLLLDARAPERWAGITEPFDPIAGRIPGSKNIFYRENLDGDSFKKPQELREMYLKALGKTPPHKVIASCGSGMTGCHTLLAMHIAGLEGGALYIGSFSEWCRNREDVGTEKSDNVAMPNQ